MKLNEIFYEENYMQAFEFISNNAGTMIKEIEADENGRRFKVIEIPKLTEKELAQQEIKELKQWFDINYTQHEQKYRRLHSLGKLTDVGTNPYDDLITLYNEAEIKRARIQELERLLSDNK